MSEQKIIKIQKLGFQWETEDPFLFTVHHQDAYPPGNDEQGPNSSLEGRALGEDFTIKDGFRMYHGKNVPGFPAHPHKGFETVTVVLEGFVDHFDSTGARGRYGNGDVQWLTTGKGCLHSEMFPLVHKDKGNPLHLFQIWLNLAAKDKTANPEYKMLWAEDIPVIETADASGRKTSIRLIAGKIQGKTSLEPTDASWAKNPNHHVGIYLLHLEQGASYSFPSVSETMNRNLYFYEGESINLDGTTIQISNRVKLAGDQDIEMTNGSKDAYILVLEGVPIGEPVAQYGPFVMNSQQELQEAFSEYRKTQFGGWPWGPFDVVNERHTGRFAQHSDGKVEKR